MEESSPAKTIEFTRARHQLVILYPEHCDRPSFTKDCRALCVKIANVMAFKIIKSPTNGEEGILVETESAEDLNEVKAKFVWASYSPQVPKPHVNMVVLHHPFGTRAPRDIFSATIERFGKINRLQELDHRMMLVVMDQEEDATLLLKEQFITIKGCRILARAFKVKDENATRMEESPQKAQPSAWLCGLPRGSNDVHMKPLMTSLNASSWRTSEYRGPQGKCWIKVSFPSQELKEQAMSQTIRMEGHALVWSNTLNCNHCSSESHQGHQCPQKPSKPEPRPKPAGHTEKSYAEVVKRDEVSCMLEEKIRQLEEQNKAKDQIIEELKAQAINVNQNFMDLKNMIEHLVAQNLEWKTQHQRQIEAVKSQGEASIAKLAKQVASLIKTQAETEERRVSTRQKSKTWK